MEKISLQEVKWGWKSQTAPNRLRNSEDYGDFEKGWTALRIARDQWPGPSICCAKCGLSFSTEPRQFYCT